MSNVWQNNIILEKADKLAHDLYTTSKAFPKSELYGITSQIRRSSLSVCLNVIEGYSRFKLGSHINFLEIAFGSLKETHYLVEFCYKENYFDREKYNKLVDQCDEVEKMLYTKIKTLKNKK